MNIVYHALTGVVGGDTIRRNSVGGFTNSQLLYPAQRRGCGLVGCACYKDVLVLIDPDFHACILGPQLGFSQYASRKNHRAHLAQHETIARSDSQFEVVRRERWKFRLARLAAWS